MNALFELGKLNFCFLLVSLLIACFLSPSVAECIGNAPSEQFDCLDGVWTSNGTVVGTNETFLSFDGPTLIKGDLILLDNATLKYTPPSLTLNPVVKVTGCTKFHNATLFVELEESLVRSLVYAPKEKNHWRYLLFMETGCSMNVQDLYFIAVINWPYGVQVNATLIDSKKTDITYFPLPKGRFGIQVGLLGGSPMSSQAWFFVLIAMACILLVLVIGSSITEKLREKKVDKKMMRTTSPINGHDDDQVPLLED